MVKPRNDRSEALTRFCLAMEGHRRTDAGRVRTAKELVAHFFPYDQATATDQLFRHIPNEVRGPVLAKWGIRGAKAALKDDDEKVASVVHDALVAGDLDDASFEEGIEPALLIDWVALPEWWSFWRQGRLTGVAIQKALATARELDLIDDTWFLDNVQSRGGKLQGTDALCDVLSKDLIVGWVRKLHETGDGTPAGIVAAIGWDTVLTKTAQDTLLFALDRFARAKGLTAEASAPAEPHAVAVPAAAAQGSGAAPASARSSVASAEPLTAEHEKLDETHPTAEPPSDAVAMAEAEALAQAQAKARLDPPDGFPIAIPDIPVIDAGDLPDDATSSPVTTGAATDAWPSGQEPPQEEESPKLAEARAAMMQTLMASGGGPATEESKREPWDASQATADPSSLEWPDPPSSAAAPISAAPPSVDVIPIEEDDLQNVAAPKPRMSGPPPVPKKPGALPRGR